MAKKENRVRKLPDVKYEQMERNRSETRTLKDYVCEYCGIYRAFKPKYNKCEEST